MKIFNTLLKLVLVLSFVFGFTTPANALSGGTWASGIKLQNLSSTSSATIVVQLRSATGTLAGEISETTGGTLLSAPASGSVEVYLPSYSTIGSGQYSAIISSDQPLGVVATTTNYQYGMADSYNSMNPSNEAFIPNVYHNHNFWSTEIFIQNTTDQLVTGQVFLEEPAGGTSSTDGLGNKTIDISLNPYATTTIDTSQPAYASMNWFIGAGRILVNGPVSVVANQTRLVGAGDVPGNVLIQSPGVTATDAGSKLVVPSLYKNFTGASGTWRSGIKFQNATGSTASATVTFNSDPDAIAFSGVKTISVPGNGSVELYLPGITLDGGGALPDMFKGSAIINVTTPGGSLSATVQHTNYAASGGYGVALGYIGFSSGMDKVSLPSLYRWPSGAGIWISGIKVQNVGNAAVTVAINLSTDVDVSTWTGAKTGIALAPGEAFELYLGGNQNLDGNTSVPQPWKGSALVVATGSGAKQIAATVLHTNYGRKVANMYTGIPIVAP